MTTLDDAAERRIFELIDNEGDPVGPITLERILRTAWTEATEAAAKKCDERASDFARDILDKNGNAKWEGAHACAAAIRGKGG